ncbi:unnamed protein product [Caenorhabditis sp. 36 PRJEB53466]|nr:unnamed protein product [Caenorhabditis sp. 36 PRJEB53466]
MWQYPAAPGTIDTHGNLMVPLGWLSAEWQLYELNGQLYEPAIGVLNRMDRPVEAVSRIGTAHGIMESIGAPNEPEVVPNAHKVPPTNGSTNRPVPGSSSKLGMNARIQKIKAFIREHRLTCREVSRMAGIPMPSVSNFIGATVATNVSTIESLWNWYSFCVDNPTSLRSVPNNIKRSVKVDEERTITKERLMEILEAHAPTSARGDCSEANG